MVSRTAIASVRQTINAGKEREIGLERLPTIPPRCEAITPERLYKDEGNCPYEACFRTSDGKLLCQIHAELWATALQTMPEPRDNRLSPPRGR